MKNWVAGLVGAGQGALTYSIQKDEEERREALRREEEARREAVLLAAEERSVAREEVTHARNKGEQEAALVETRRYSEKREGELYARGREDKVVDDELQLRLQKEAEARRIAAETNSRRTIREEEEAYAPKANELRASQIASDEAAKAKAAIDSAATTQEAIGSGKIKDPDQKAMSFNTVDKALGDSLYPSTPPAAIEKTEKRYFAGQTATTALESGIEQDDFVDIMLGDSDSEKEQRTALQSRIHISLATGLKGTIAEDTSKYKLGGADIARYASQVKDETAAVMGEMRRMATEAKDPKTPAGLQAQFDHFVGENDPSRTKPLEENLSAFYKLKVQTDLKKIAAQFGDKNPGGLQMITAAYAGAWQSAYGEYMDRLKYGAR